MFKLEILELVVVGFKRLALKEDKSFTITPATIHLILGTNGSGKSSLMDLLTPLPPLTKDFTEDGFKKITLRYDDDIYTVHSSNNKHTMLKNNEVIIENAGINKMIELCYEYFKITPSIHRFMLGKANMSTMSLQHRKEFISSISNIDFDYVNNLYNIVKKKVRDNNAIIKHLNNKVLSMKEYILNDEEVDKLVEQKKEINLIVEKLYINKYIVSPSKDMRELNVRNTKRKIDNLKYGMDVLKVPADSIKDRANELNKSIEKDRLELIEVSNRLLDLSTTVDYQTAKELLEEIDLEVKQLELNRIINVDEMKFIRGDLSNILELSFELKEHNVDNINKLIDSNRAEYNKLLEEYTPLVNDNEAMASKIDTYKSSSGKLSCPDCGFHFHTDSLSSIVKSLEDDITKNNILIDKKSKELKDIKDTGSDYESIKSKCDRLKMMIVHSGIVSLSSYVDHNDILDVYHYLDKLVNDINTLPRLVELKKKRETLILTKDDNTKEEVEKLNKEYGILKQNIEAVESTLNSYNQLYNLKEDVESEVNSIKHQLSLLNYNRKNEINKEKNRVIETIIPALKQKIYNIDTTLEKFNYMSKTTQSHLDEVNKVSDEVRILEILIRELSPATGLIGESIKSFLGEYIDEVNAIINKVWSYDLEVLPYDLVEIEKGITYRFPVKTKGDDNSTDINDTSESMREIINIAFRLVSLRYMGLGKFPLMIDEFGRNMDEIHLIKSYDMLDGICDINDVQMFIISHIKTCYNRFKNAGISIVSDLNLEQIDN